MLSSNHGDFWRFLFYFLVWTSHLRRINYWIEKLFLEVKPISSFLIIKYLKNKFFRIYTLQMVKKKHNSLQKTMDEKTHFCMLGMCIVVLIHCSKFKHLVLKRSTTLAYQAPYFGFNWTSKFYLIFYPIFFL